MEYPEISGSQIINMSNAINGAMLDLWKGAYKVFQTDRSIIGEAISDDQCGHICKLEQNLMNHREISRSKEVEFSIARRLS